MKRPAPHRSLIALLLAAACFVASGSTAASAAPRQQGPDADRAALEDVFGDLADIRRVLVVDGVADYSPAAVEARGEALRRIRARFDRIDPAQWPVADKVDYLLVRAQLDAEDFVHRVTRPWARDPGLYVDHSRIGIEVQHTLHGIHIEQECLGAELLPPHGMASAGDTDVTPFSPGPANSGLQRVERVD